MMMSDDTTRPSGWQNTAIANNNNNNHAVSVQADTAMQEGGSDHDSDSSTTITSCPLFMEGLPRDFSTNPQLAAIASLLEDTVPEEHIPLEDEQDQTINHTNYQQTIATTANSKKKKYVYKCVGKRYSKAKRRSITNTKFSYHDRTTTTATKHRRNCSTPTPTTPQTPFPTPIRTTTTATSTSEDGCTSKLSSSSVGEAMLFLNMWKL
ncbi:hypothetical protein IV203_035418 [Nitzschia inconspicua]|uniref:Uncharacterized protein n=1 Tax=Nitzschia inconspicua TaxID=303405 RepID=A0A9K3LDE8_9STRA|nr:hypothetical protein IV203_006791 [Nitzschia inconspicua]KAG7360319.1 hypothetical protein IV203_035418 [Nitzschia inconspicua]